MMVSDDDIALVTSGRWLMPLLAEMSAEGSARFAVLLRRLGLSRSALSRSIGALEARGWLTRNPGHGHPLRPEYLLTDQGRPVAAWCEARWRRGGALDWSGSSRPLVAALSAGSTSWKPSPRWGRAGGRHAAICVAGPRDDRVRLLERRLERLPAEAL